MADSAQLEMLKRDVGQWNTWREEYPRLKPDLYQADLYGVDLSLARLDDADLRESTLYRANLTGADLTDADLRNAKLGEANLLKTILFHADLREADLSLARMVETDLREAQLAGSIVYGVAAWDVKLEGADQTNLIITRPYFDEPVITVDRLEVAQFIYLLLNNKSIRDVIDTVTTKAVLILGRFTPERKGILDALRERLRALNYLPIIFDFESSARRDLSETISTLAHMARFIIADITDAKSVPQELQRIVPLLPSVPVQPLILDSQHEYALFRDLTVYPWVLPLVRYETRDHLLASLEAKIITPAIEKWNELQRTRNSA